MIKVFLYYIHISFLKMRDFEILNDDKNNKNWIKNKR